MTQLIILQRIELLGSFSKKVRKFFGRYLFTNLITKFFFNKKKIGEKYFEIMQSELLSLEKNINFNKKNILSIGSGLGGFEAMVNYKYKDNCYTFIEKNIISKKVKYGWDSNNNEAYNDLELLKLFLLSNKMNKKNFEIFNFDSDLLPKKQFNIIISLYSLDYHYDFNLYLEYFKDITNEETLIVFDTIRPEYFINIFKKVKIVKTDDKTIHKSKRIICSDFII